MVGLSLKGGVMLIAIIATLLSAFSPNAEAADANVAIRDITSIFSEIKSIRESCEIPVVFSEEEETLINQLTAYQERVIDVSDLEPSESFVEADIFRDFMDVSIGYWGWRTRFRGGGLRTVDEEKEDLEYLPASAIGLGHVLPSEYTNEDIESLLDESGYAHRWIEPPVIHINFKPRMFWEEELETVCDSELYLGLLQAYFREIFTRHLRDLTADIEEATGLQIRFQIDEDIFLPGWYTSSDVYIGHNENDSTVIDTMQEGQFQSERDGGIYVDFRYAEGMYRVQQGLSNVMYRPFGAEYIDLSYGLDQELRMLQTVYFTRQRGKNSDGYIYIGDQGISHAACRLPVASRVENVERILSHLSECILRSLGLVGRSHTPLPSLLVNRDGSRDIPILPSEYDLYLLNLHYEHLQTPQVPGFEIQGWLDSYSQTIEKNREQGNDN